MEEALVYLMLYCYFSSRVVAAKMFQVMTSMEEVTSMKKRTQEGCPKNSASLWPSGLPKACSREPFSLCLHSLYGH